MINAYSTLGILGGMGPYATLRFYEILLDLTSASKDSEHLHVVLDVNPHIPSRSRYYLYGEASPVPMMIDACLRLHAYPVDLIALPCNSACAFLDQLQPHVQVEILNIIDITAAATANRVGPGTRIAVLGGVVTTGNETYRTYLEQRNLIYCPHSSDIQRQSDDLIYGIKKLKITNELKTAFKHLLKNVALETRAEAFILGCTEFGFLSLSDTTLTIIDSTTELARYCLRLFKD